MVHAWAYALTCISQIPHILTIPYFHDWNTSPTWAATKYTTMIYKLKFLNLQKCTVYSLTIIQPLHAAPLRNMMCRARNTRHHIYTNAIYKCEIQVPKQTRSWLGLLAEILKNDYPKSLQLCKDLQVKCYRPSWLGARTRLARLSSRNHHKTPVANNGDIKQPASCTKIFEFTLR